MLPLTKDNALLVECPMISINPIYTKISVPTALNPDIKNLNICFFIIMLIYPIIFLKILYTFF